MKRAFFILFSILFVFPSALRAAELLDKIVAVVNDDVITQSEIDRNLMPFFQEYRKRYQGEEFIKKMTETRSQVLNQMVEDKLVLQEAKKKGVKVSEEEIDRKTLENQKRFRSADDFQRFLDSQGVTLTAMRDRYRDMIMIQKIQYLEVRSKVAVSPVETERFYRENPEKFVMPEAFHVSSITIRKKSASAEAARESELAREKLLGLRKRIVEGGVPFDEVARQNSEDTHAAEGGDMGWISRGDFIRELEEAIFRLKPKEVTPVLESDIGWHLFRLEEHRAKKTKTFEETKEQIEGYLYSEKSRKRFEEWVARLRKDAYISIR